MNVLIVLLSFLLLLPVPARADRKQDHGAAMSAQEFDFGRQGDPKKAARRVRVELRDTMRFEPAALTIRRGETVRFDLRNSGKVMHEMVLGTMQGLKEHAEMMKAHPGMAHDDPFGVHVAPGKRAALVWQFTKAGEFHYGCLVPGHFEAGMVGRITVKD